MDGSYYAIDFRGRSGKPLQDHWSGQGGPRAHLGISTSLFPNLFFVNGPGVAFANNPPVAEQGAKFGVELIQRAEELRKEGKGNGVVESTKEAEEKWLGICNAVGDMTLFSKTPSWLFGENIPGKKRAARAFFGGLGRWRAAIADVKAKGYEGFVFGEK